MIKKALFFSFAIVLFGTTIYSKEYPNKKKRSNSVNRAVGCTPATAQADLDINNVRFRVLTGGDLWWDASSTPVYQVPKNANSYGYNTHSIFAGALWIGGIDATGQLKVAAQSYRQTGDDFWPGPINIVSGDITPDRCNYYDRVWKISKKEVVNFVASGTGSQNINEWPGNGDAAFNEDQFLAPFYDKDANGLYNPSSGDYPNYPIGVDLSNSNCEGYLWGDEVLWWVFNDKGNIHTETNGEQLGIEVRAQAYAFKKNNALDNMTFYNYQMINRSNIQINEMYFGQWVDPDLGNAVDDYLGCDVQRGLGYCYNGDNNDDGPGGYGLNPPAVGVDIIRGPIADANDGVDNDRDGITDEFGERIQMTSYHYYGGVGPTDNPYDALGFYRYLKSIWLDGLHVTFGGYGRDQTQPPTNFFYSNGTDPDFPGQVWNELTAGNPPGDRRFVMSAGPFTFAPGAVQNVDIGVVWARASAGGALASLEDMQIADDFAQAFFDNCFQEFKGPKAPELAIRELNQQIIISLENTYNNDVELFSKVDPYISPGLQPDIEKRKYKFQGFQVYQLRDANITLDDIGDPDKVRLIGQCDVKDSISQIINYNYDENLNQFVASEKVNGFNEGIKHTFQVKYDAFAPANTILSNHNTYYYTAVAYAYNNYKEFDPTKPYDNNFTQQEAYLRSTENVQVYSAIPHSPSVEIGGTIQAADFNVQPRITRIEGTGNGGFRLDLTQETVDEILNSPFHRAMEPEYYPNVGPVGVSIADPLNVRAGNYELKFSGVDSTDSWRMKHINDNILVFGNNELSEPYQQLIPDWGLNAEVSKVSGVASAGAIGNGGGFISAAVSSSQWLEFLQDVDIGWNEPLDWIRAGSEFWDLTPDEEWENASSWAPYKIVSKDSFGPKWRGVAEAQLRFDFLNSVDVVITSDKSKWTRVPVVEMGFVEALNVGNADKASMRAEQSVDKNGNFAAVGSGVSSNSDDANFISETGMGWFPGYAINIENGERLNMAFGENSSLANQNARDMIWNPTSEIIDNSNNVVFGGGHYIYIFDRNNFRGDRDVPVYDFGEWLVEHFSSGIIWDKRHAWKDCIWTSIPILKQGASYLSDDVKIRLRVVKDYEAHPGNSTILDNEQELTVGTSYFVFGDEIIHNNTNYFVGDVFTAVDSVFFGNGFAVTPLPINDFNPFYSFSTDELVAETNNIDFAKSKLSTIRAVPNPYYSYTGYEHISQSDRVKFTNLPAKCTISIYNVNGSLVKRIKRNLSNNNQTSGGSIEENMDTSESWDLKNESGKLVGSGVYIVHVDAFELGERTFKWAAFTRNTNVLNKF